MLVNRALFELCRLSDSLEGDDTFHQRRVCIISYELAREIGLDRGALSLLVRSALLHDIGLLTDSDKTETFRQIAYEEFSSLNRHAVLGGKVARFLNLHLDITNAINLHHTPHEENSSVLGNILFLADNVEIAYRSLTNPFAYDDLIGYLEQKKRIFDPSVFDALKRVAKRECFWFSLLEEHVDDSVRRIIDELPDDRADEKFETALIYLLSFMSDNVAPFYDRYTLFVKNLAVNMGYKLGLDTKLLHRASLLSHVGNLKIPYTLFSLPSLEEENYNIIKSHTFEGFGTLNRMGFDREAELVLLHHENNLEEGYPCRVKPEGESAVLALATVVAAIMQDRPYRDAKSDDSIKKGLENFKELGIFDGELIDAVVDIDLSKVRETEDEYYNATKRLFT